MHYDPWGSSSHTNDPRGKDSEKEYHQPSWHNRPYPYNLEKALEKYTKGQTQKSVNENQGNSHLDDPKVIEAANFFKENILKKRNPPLRRA